MTDVNRLRAFAGALRATTELDIVLASGDVGRYVTLSDLEALLDVYEAACAARDLADASMKQGMRLSRKADVWLDATDAVDAAIDASRKEPT